MHPRPAPFSHPAAVGTATLALVEQWPPYCPSLDLAPTFSSSQPQAGTISSPTAPPLKPSDGFPAPRGPKVFQKLPALHAPLLTCLISPPAILRAHSAPSTSCFLQFPQHSNRAPAWRLCTSWRHPPAWNPLPPGILMTCLLTSFGS